MQQKSKYHPTCNHKEAEPFFIGNSLYMVCQDCQDIIKRAVAKHKESQMIPVSRSWLSKLIKNNGDLKEENEHLRHMIKLRKEG